MANLVITISPSPVFGGCRVAKLSLGDTSKTCLVFGHDAPMTVARVVQEMIALLDPKHQLVGSVSFEGLEATSETSIVVEP